MGHPLASSNNMPGSKSCLFFCSYQRKTMTRSKSYLCPDCNFILKMITPYTIILDFIYQYAVNLSKCNIFSTQVVKIMYTY